MSSKRFMFNKREEFFADIEQGKSCKTSSRFQSTREYLQVQRMYGQTIMLLILTFLLKYVKFQLKLR